MRKPSNIIYGVDDLPPPVVTIVSGLQHVGLISIFLLFPLLIFREAGLDAERLRNALSLSMLALGAGVLLSGIRFGPVGSGFLCAPVFSAFYLGPSLLAVKVGGLPLVFGMTVFGGAVEAALSRVQRHLRAVFPPELAGFLVLLIGVSIGAIGIRHLLGLSAPRPADASEVLVGACTLGAMVGLTIWTRGALKMFSALVGMIVGYLMASLIGVLSADDVNRVVTAPLVSAPSLAHLGWSWDVNLVVPFAIGAVAACLKAVGCVTTCQKINDADWVRPDLRSLERGVLADALGTITAGIVGAPGLNSSPTSIGVSHATGVTSRRVAYAIAAIFTALAFFPQAASLLAVMPPPVIGAALLFSASFVFINGLQIISSRLLDARRTFVIGLSFMIGMAVDLFPAYFAQFPASLQPLLGSSIVLGMVCAMLLNAVFIIGTRQRARLTVDVGQPDPVAIEEFMEKQGAEWGARRDVIEKAKFNLVQSVETIVQGCNPQGALEIEATFDEFSLDIRISYPGAPLVLPDKRPTSEEIIASEEGERALAGFLLRRLADRVSASHSADRSTVHFHFDH